MPDKTNDTVIATVMEQLMAEGPEAMAQVITALMNLAMRMEREQFLGAGHYERSRAQRHPMAAGCHGDPAAIAG
jgi:putative transposase